MVLCSIEFLIVRMLKLILLQLSAQVVQNVKKMLNIIGWLVIISKMFIPKQFAHIHFSKLQV
jgi:hypothetical protein